MNMMPETQKLESDFRKIYGKAKENPDISEEELRVYFNKTGILESLGYKSIGKDIRIEKYIRGKRSDIHCLDDYGNVIFVIEFKKPSERKLKEHFDQLWDQYVKPLRAKYGVLTNGLEIIIYQRIGTNSNVIVDTNLSDLKVDLCELISERLQKPEYYTTKRYAVLEYFKRFSDSYERRPLISEFSRELFFEDFMLEEGSLFARMVQETIVLFDSQYGKLKADNTPYFVTSAFDFWVKSYAKKPERLPVSWKGLLSNIGLTTSNADLNKFMFCLETAYALFTRLILAKACEDYEFPHVDFADFMKRVKGYRGSIPLISWGVLLTEWIENMRESLVESVFEEDIFYWWTDEFSSMRSWSAGELWSSKDVDVKLVSFTKCLADMLFTLYKYDFSKIAGDPLGDLYQKYFDKETRKALGEFYTPKEIVGYILESIGYNGHFVANKRLLDPACGSGTFLVDALRRYLDVMEDVAEEEGWGAVLTRLCNEFHIVGFDIHPFATIMAQIHFMLALIPYYKKAIDEEEYFVIRRIPIFRTDSLFDERKSTDIMSFANGMRNIVLRVQLPIKSEEDFVEVDVTMPSFEEVWKKTDLQDVPDYFCALQAIFDTVKYLARDDKYVVDKKLLEENLKAYPLIDKNWGELVDFFTYYADQILITIKDLKYRFGDGRLVKSIEDAMLAGLLKNYVKYDFVVGNPPYVRTRKFTKKENIRFRENYWTPYGSFDIYVPFMERGIRWMKEGGKFGFVTSNKYFIVDYGKKLRAFILNNCEIQQLVDLSFCPDAFEEPFIYAAITILKRRGGDIVENVEITNPQTNKIFVGIALKNDRAVLNDILSKLDGENHHGDDFSTVAIIQERLSKNIEYWFDVYAIGFENLIGRIHRDSGRLAEHYAVNGGFMGWEYHVAEKCISDGVREGDIKYKKILTPSLIESYQILWGEKPIDIFGKKFYHPYLSYDDTIRENLWNIFERKKLIARGIAKNVSIAYDHEGQAMLVNTFGITPKTPDANLTYLLGLLNSKLCDFYHKVHFFLARIPEGSFRYPKQFWENIPIKLPKTVEEKQITSKIISKVDQILFQVNIEQAIKNFPNSYIRDYRGEEFEEIRQTFNADHGYLDPKVEKRIDEGYNVVLGRKEKPIAVERMIEVEYVLMALNGRKVKRGEKITVLIPKHDRIIEKVLTQYKNDIENIKALPIPRLEKEIDDLVYELYGLSEQDKDAIEKFLEKL